MNDKIDILFINPSLDFQQDLNYFKNLRVDSTVPRQQSPFIGIAYLLAAARRYSIKAKFLDMVAYKLSVQDVLDYIKEHCPSLIGIRAFTVQIKTAGAVANEIKKVFPDIKVCVSGPHASAMPTQTLEEFPAFDFLVCGEAEMILPKIMENMDKLDKLAAIKGVVTRYKTDSSWERIKELDELSFPAWDEFKLDAYPGADPHCTKLELPISTSRGCPNSCIFCFRAFGKKRNHRTVGNVIKEMEYDIEKFGCEAFLFCDETLTVDSKWSFDFINTIIKRGLHNKIRWSCETRVDSASDELFALMKKAGCYYIFFGFESGNDSMLKLMGKGFTVNNIKKAVKSAKNAGIICSGSFIIGLPGENEDTINNSIALAKELDIYSITFPIAVPFPGTDLRKMAENSEYGLSIITNNWDDYGKQYPGVMESRDLGIQMRRLFQERAYECIPKKQFPEIKSYSDINSQNKGRE